jgi:DNA-binding NtrC family response regulator
MEKEVVVLDADEKQCKELCAVLKERHYRVDPMHSLLDLESHIQGSGCRLVILDLDTIPVDNLALRELKRKNPGLYIVGLSKRQFHPELEEAIGSHIYACLGKPVDPDELVYWLRSIYEDDADQKDPSGA